ncbi:MAG TPA: hypothetical protein VFS43_07035 [Polyangiaceae bacterium]|nr:hypothetical protein [Polyangiaceae bacterium]
MARTKVFPLDAVRADGWFERIGEGIGSFHALCEIVGDRFVAFSLITGARITALSVDRRALDNTIVDFVVGGRDDEGEPEPQRLTLGDFRRRLVAALLAEEVHGPPPGRENDTEGIQLFIGIRTLLLSPIYGYSLRKLVVEGDGRAQIEVLHDGLDEEYDLTSFRARLRAHVRDELDRVSSNHRGAIDLGRIAEAESAAEAGDFVKVRQLLGTWPAPLAIFLRTPDGQMLGAEARALIAKGLGLLGSACVRLGDIAHGEEIFRLGVQYAQEGGAAGDVFRRLGEALLLDGRPGEAVAALRRAINLGAQGHMVWPLLTRAFLLRKRYVAAYACLREAQAAGTPEAELADDRLALEQALGPGLTAWRAKMVASGRSN